MPGVGEVVGGSVREEREAVMRDRLTRWSLTHSHTQHAVLYSSYIPCPLRLGLFDKYQW